MVEGTSPLLQGMRNLHDLPQEKSTRYDFKNTTIKLNSSFTTFNSSINNLVLSMQVANLQYSNFRTQYINFDAPNFRLGIADVT